MPALRQREPRRADLGYLAFVRRQRCCACGARPPVQAAHVRMGRPDRGKRAAGLGEKPDDRWAVPLCADCHLDGPGAQHRVGEERFWRRLKLDPVEIAEGLYAGYRLFEDMKTARYIGGDLIFPRTAKADSRIRRPKSRAVQIKRGGDSGRKIKVSGFRSSTDKPKPKRKWPSRKIRSRNDLRRRRS